MAPRIDAPGVESEQALETTFGFAVIAGDYVASGKLPLGFMKP